jgi:hypothetical protein
VILCIFANAILMINLRTILMKQLSFILILTVSLLLSGFTQTSGSYVMDVNNISALLKTSGIHFFDTAAHYEVPKGSGKNTIFTHALWIGGFDPDDQLHLAAMRHGQIGNDYQTGPVAADMNVTAVHAAEYDRFYVVNRSDIEAFLQSGSSAIPDSFWEWPAHGDTTIGQAFYLAPFKDADNDGLYNPRMGDYPLIKGDRTAFYIFNDYRDHTESHALSGGLEMHAMFYAFDTPQNDIFNNTLFINYKIYNRSNVPLQDCYVGLFTDIDLGYPNDDYIGCHVQKGFYYGYNGIDSDYVYGINPPIQTVIILGGARLEADGRDNPAFSLDSITAATDYCSRYFNSGYPADQYGYNGMNFGDGIIDNERMGMTKFFYFNNNNSVTGGPNIPIDYYNLLQGLWRDSTKMKYGGNAHTANGGIGPECNFMFPGLSDPCHWGTNGIDPNVLSYGNEGWTERTSSNAPADRLGLSSTGPFSFPAGAMEEFDFALTTVFPSGEDTVFTFLGPIADSVRTAFNRGITPYGQDFTPYAIPHTATMMPIKVYPNPAQDQITVLLPATIPEALFTLYDLRGKALMTQPVAQQKTLNISHLPAGLYLYRVADSKHIYSGKIAVSR